MTGAELRAGLRAGRQLYGTLIVADSPRWPDSVAKIGLDFVFIDTEHIAIDRPTLSWMCQTYRALGLPPVVRITAPDPYEACCVLDGGACGVVAPYVETVAQAEALCGAVKLRPLKGRRLQEALRDTASLQPELAGYIERHNAHQVLLINVESQPAIDNLDALLAVPGVDGVLIGPHDLSTSLGLPEQYDHPRFEAAVRTIFRQARARHLAAGIHSWMGVERELSWAGPEGANFFIHEGDIIAMRIKLTSDLAALRARLGGTATGPAAGTENI